MSEEREKDVIVRYDVPGRVAKNPDEVIKSIKLKMYETSAYKNLVNGITVSCKDFLAQATSFWHSVDHMHRLYDLNAASSVVVSNGVLECIFSCIPVPGMDGVTVTEVKFSDSEKPQTFDSLQDALVTIKEKLAKNFRNPITLKRETDTLPVMEELR